MSDAVVVVGVGLGGARIVEDLRSRGYHGELALIGRESHVPYDRPPLSKTVLTERLDRVDLHPDGFDADN
ncbi:FAD-dependent oxidoreductase [Nocardia sp. 348MFTsu5.1]|uniref:FAD-dependent oxidoreductase n=1 Tax=Nocardia sp. 348MFTsu5.1 TaxID=1172185 RepID=UPI0012DF884A|nr:FAD-dependent oxidoreductase [Nocardia sp. 348MFTsu5.1]